MTVATLRLCSWCGSALEDFEAGYGDTVVITHGICESCQALEEMALRQRRGDRSCKNGKKLGFADGLNS